MYRKVEMYSPPEGTVCPSLSDLIIEVDSVLEHLLCSLDIEQDVWECPDSILIPPHHQVRETHVVVRRDLAGGYTRIHVLEIDIHNILKYHLCFHTSQKQYIAEVFNYCTSVPQTLLACISFYSTRISFHKLETHFSTSSDGPWFVNKDTTFFCLLYFQLCSVVLIGTNGEAIQFL